MIIKPDIASIHPVARIAPLLAVDNIGGAAQELSDRATQFVKGQQYFAHVLSRAGESTYNVKVENENLKGTILKMDLGATAKAGQTLLLKYMHDSPVPTFLLTLTDSKDSGSTTKLSTAASLISQYLKQAEGDGVSNRFVAVAVVTQTPNNPLIMAHDLKNALRSSGLFYESHLSDLLQSNQTLSALKQEPQNQSSTSMASLMSQQLAVLENQRLAWHGEVWPRQKMDWDVYLQERGSEGDDGQASNESDEGQARPIASEMTLHLPHLGKVSARINLVDGHMRVNILAEQAQTLDILKSQRLRLAEAIGKNGQQLDALTVVRHE
ncbi:flagellar hook-length control protein FliK [Methylotenera sp.]|uniref:flagellar hook-length control protein FliK n=1 Tax=Methylotenera sp. TaxID=2051956 RepID=UPI00272073C1|nr:flagellar hook-length control protein FliK [Methylotenera sp.]MDO9204335.1 flagellar hook-length control protein FliK [Methylotenera sp.]